MATIQLTRDYPFSASLIWDRISDFHALHTWLPGIKDTERDSADPSLRRVIREDGAIVLEKEIAKSDVDRSVHYTIIGGDVPVRDFDGNITVVDRSGGGATVNWEVSFKSDVNEDEVAEAIAELLTNGLENLDTTD